MTKNWSAIVEPAPSIHPSKSSNQLLWSDEDGFSVEACGTGNQPEYKLCFWDEVTARINPQQKTIRITPLSPATTPATLEHLLHDQIYPRLLAHEGQLVLHAGAVKIGDQLAVFLGDSGMGKSTLVASLYQAGAALLNDDTLVATAEANGFYGQAIYQGLRLLPDSLASLFPQQTKTRPMAHYSPKQRLDVALASEQDSRPRALGALFFLAPASTAIGLRRMTAAEACMGLITNSFSLDPTDTALARHKLQQAAALANGIPAFALSYPRDYNILPQVHTAIRAKMAECRPQPDLKGELSF